MEDRFVKRLRKKAKRGMRGYPVASVAYYGPDDSRASKVAVGILLSEAAEADDLRSWIRDDGDVRSDSGIAEEILEYIASFGALTVVMTDRIIGCPHQQGIDYEGRWCPVCDYWKGRDRFTGDLWAEDAPDSAFTTLPPLVRGARRR